MSIAGSAPVFDPKQPFIVISVPNSAQYNDLEQRFRALFGLPG